MQGRKLLAICLFFSIPALWGQTDASETAPAVLAIIAPETGADPTLQSVLSESLVLELARRGVRADIEAGPAGRDALLSRATKQGAGYLVTGSYATTGREITLRFALFETPGGKSLGVGSMRGPINLSLENVVRSALEQTLSGVKLKGSSLDSSGVTEPVSMGSLVRQPGSGTTAPDLGTANPDSGTAVPDSGTGTAGNSSEDVAVHGPAGSPGTGQGPAVGPAKDLAQQVTPGPWKLIAASTGIAPLIPVGPTADYSKIGLFSTLTLDVRFPVGQGALAAGLLTGFSWLAANGAVAGADISLLPVGADLVYTFFEPSFPVFSIRLSGGLSVMTVAAAYLAEPLTKLVPFALGGIILDFPFAPFLGLALGASFVSFFEDSLWIMGFTPQVSLYFRL